MNGFGSIIGWAQRDQIGQNSATLVKNIIFGNVEGLFSIFHSFKFTWAYFNAAGQFVAVANAQVLNTPSGHSDWAESCRHTFSIFRLPPKVIKKARFKIQTQWG